MKKQFSLVIIVVLLFSGMSPALAESQEDMMSMMRKMSQQMADMQKTIEDQNLRIQQLESKSKVFTEPAPQASMAMSDSDFQKNLKDNIGEAIPWAKGVKFSGDFRLRNEYFDWYDKESDAGANDATSRNRFRIRLRFGFEKEYGDDWKVGFRLATATPSTTNGVATDNTGTNVTLGNPGLFTFKNIYLNKAYAQYSPSALKDYGAVKGVTIGAGKFENPFLRYSTPIMWDGDVTPEGL